jgi:putative methyltransferase (TIGR04325 family)
MNIRRLPIVGSFLEARYRRRFRSANGLGTWYGDFEAFEAAAAGAPQGAPIGYDTPGTETLYDNFFRVDAKGFPVLFWLEKILKPGARIFDFGGHVGHTFLAYRELLSEGATMDWKVYDVPTVVAEGCRRVAKGGLQRLSFTSDFADASGADVLHAAGSLQYAPRTLPDMISDLPTPPAHIIINMMPTVAAKTIVTLQNIGPSYCPYRIEGRSILPRGLAALGYDQVAGWENPEGRTHVPYDRQARRISWVGFYFRRSSSPIGERYPESSSAFAEWHGQQPGS